MTTTDQPFTPTKFERYYAELFGSEQSAWDAIAQHEVSRVYPDARPVWVGFEYDAEDGGYFVTTDHSINPVPPGGRRYLSIRANEEMTQESWDAEVSLRVPEDWAEILEWLDTPDGRMPPFEETGHQNIESYNDAMQTVNGWRDNLRRAAEEAISCR